MNIAIVTDSTSDITPALASEHGIHVVPAILVLEGENLEDGRGISRDDLYRRLPTMKNLPTTAAPSVGSFQQLYQELLKKGADRIISIHVSSLLSGIFNAAVQAGEEFGNKVHVVDSCHVTLGMGYQVIAAAQAARNGMNVNEIQKVIDEIRKRIHLVAMLDTLEYAHRSGRISWTRYNLSSLLQIKPFVGVQDGKVIRMGETRTRQKGIERLRQLLSALRPLERLAVLHTNAEAEAVQFAEQFKAYLIQQPLVINVTSIIGVHVGPNGLGFVAVTAE